MSRQEKQRSRLTILEIRFRTTLRRHLGRVAEEGDSRFFGTERFGPFPNAYLRRQKRPIESILSLGDEILRLREQLEEPPSEIVLSLHRACKEANDYSNEHRLGPIRLAQRLLAELGNCCRTSRSS